MARVQLAPIHTKLLKARTLIGAGTVGVSHTGDTLLFQFALIAIPAATLGPNGRLIWDISWNFTGAGGTRTVTYKLGSAAVFSSGALAATNLSARHLGELANRNNQASQIVGVATNLSTAAPTTSIDTSAATTFSIEGQLANAADTMVLETWMLEVIYGA